MPPALPHPKLTLRSWPPLPLWGQASGPYNPSADSPCLVPVSASWQLSPETEVARIWGRGEEVGKGPRGIGARIRRGGSHKLGGQNGGHMGGRKG